MFTASKRIKERLLRRLAMTKKLQARNDNTSVIARDEAISFVHGWPSRKERLLRRLAMTNNPRCARNDKMGEIAALRSQ